MTTPYTTERMSATRIKMERERELEPQPSGPGRWGGRS